MRTKELLEKIRTILIQTPDFIRELPVEDIVSCVYVELYGLRQLYAKEHFEELEKRLFYYRDSLNEAVKDNDTSAALKNMETLMQFHSILPDSEISGAFVEKANYNEVLINHICNNTLLVIGDSHVNFFSGNETLNFIPIGNGINTCKRCDDQPISVFHMGPCLAFRSDTYGSTNAFREKLDFVLNRFANPGDKILIAMGEIDIRAHVFIETEKQGKSYEEIVDSIVEHYAKLLGLLKERDYNVWCWGAIGTQKDGKCNDAEYPSVGTEVERNRATEYFNGRMMEICNENGIGFLSVFDEMVDSNYHTREEYLSVDGCHLGNYCYPEVLGVLKQVNLI